LNDEQIKQLHKSIDYVCTTSVDVLADSEQFPEEWLFKHRWSKGKKNQPSLLPNGDKIVFLTVGGRTSAVVPAVQKKTGPVAKEISEDDDQLDEKENKAETKGKRKRTAVKEEEDEDKDEQLRQNARRQKRAVLVQNVAPEANVLDLKDDCKAKTNTKQSLRIRYEIDLHHQIYHTQRTLL
jgi:formamidopyrimidine-DNA glycosylase